MPPWAILSLAALKFESMDEFSPGAIAQKVAPLKELLDARNELSNLMTYMDGKPGAEELISDAMNNPELLKSLAATPAAADDEGEE